MCTYICKHFRKFMYRATLEGRMRNRKRNPRLLFFRRYRKSFHDHVLNMRRTIVYVAIVKERLCRSSQLLQIPSVIPIESSFWDLSKISEKDAFVTCVLTNLHQRSFRFSYFYTLMRAEMKPADLKGFNIIQVSMLRLQL